MKGKHSPRPYDHGWRCNSSCEWTEYQCRMSKSPFLLNMWEINAFERRFQLWNCSYDQIIWHISQFWERKFSKCWRNSTSSTKIHLPFSRYTKVWGHIQLLSMSFYVNVKNVPPNFKWKWLICSATRTWEIDFIMLDTLSFLNSTLQNIFSAYKPCMTKDNPSRKHFFFCMSRFFQKWKWSRVNLESIR
jgi:hypothetical protein